MQIVEVILIIIICMFLVGITAEIEDNSPGGFDNPDGKWRDVFKNPTKVQVFVWIFAIIFFIALYFAILKWNTV